MMYGKKKIGKLVKKYMKVEPVPNRRWSGKLSVSSSRGSGRSSGSDTDYWDDADDAPVGVPEGCLAVYVGPEMRRFVIQASFLYKQVFRELLRRSEEEYGFDTEGGLRIPCEPGVFEKLLWQLENENF
jgi:SAUR family protein